MKILHFRAMSFLLRNVTDLTLNAIEAQICTLTPIVSFAPSVAQWPLIAI